MEADVLEKELRPIENGEMSAALYRLQGHYWQPNMTQSLANSVASDYVRLLGGYPKSVFLECCDKWLLEDNKFFPKIGELKVLLDERTFLKKWRLKRVTKMLEKAE